MMRRRLQRVVKDELSLTRTQNLPRMTATQKQAWQRVVKDDGSLTRPHNLPQMTATQKNHSSNRKLELDQFHAHDNIK